MKQVEGMPSWVYWGLWGINSRKVAVIFLLIVSLLTLILVPVGVYFHEFSSVLLIGGPIWYWLAIKWADKNLMWPASVS